VDELLPFIRKDYRISDNPDDRGIAGASSGAICAFTVAWHRPDAFRNVISAIGSYVNRASPCHRRPAGHLGRRDLSDMDTADAYQADSHLPAGWLERSRQHWGNWFLADQQMVKAFEFANRTADGGKVAGPRYDVKYEWGDAPTPTPISVLCCRTCFAGSSATPGQRRVALASCVGIAMPSNYTRRTEASAMYSRSRYSNQSKSAGNSVPLRS